MDLSHSHELLICAYEGVNGVNSHLIAQSFALSLLRQLLESIRFIPNSVFSVALNVRHFASL
jgi:hypothetical protein